MTARPRGLHYLHRSVLDVISAAGCDIEDAESPRRLQAHHALPGASEQDLEILARRMARPTDLDHARSEGRHRRPSAAVIEIDRIVLRAIAPHLHEITDWHSWHSCGDNLNLIASRFGAEPIVVRLALQGLPGRLYDPRVVHRLDRAGQVWRAGGSTLEVAAALDRSVSWFRRARRSGHVALYPDRLQRADIAARAGVAGDRVNSWAHAGILPSPDGLDGRPWWWEPDITAWIASALPHRCPHCAARLPTLTGLRVHVSKKHAGSR